MSEKAKHVCQPIHSLQLEDMEFVCGLVGSCWILLEAAAKRHQK
jgi:hypothetical protein